MRLGADPFSSVSKPVESFEIVIPGTTVGLGAWDLIGMFGGIPLFVWIGFGFATRNGRTAKFEGMLRAANSREELEQVAHRWEYSLMLRMLGPHQGIRLERLRAELDDGFEFAEKLSSEHLENKESGSPKQEAKTLPSIRGQSDGSQAPPKETQATSFDEKGYEWVNDDSGIDWYRVKDSGDEWEPFEN